MTPQVSARHIARGMARRMTRGVVPSILFYTVSIALAAFFILPIAWTLITAIKPANESSASPPTFLPTRFSLENFIHLAQSGDGIMLYVMNSLIVAALTVSLTIVLSTLAGYGFARMKFPGKNMIFVGILATLMIPFQSIVIPLFLTLRALSVSNTLLGLALVYTTFQLPFGIFVMRNTFAAIPTELDESAKLDGCSSFTLLYRVLLRLALPGVITVALFAFFNAWNEFLAALIFMQDPQNYTLPIQLVNVQSQFQGGVDWGALQAGVTVSMIPCLVIFFLLQRYYIRGLVEGAVKG